MIDKVDPGLLIASVAEKLKSEIHKPAWASFVKTGTHKQRPPVDEDWWYFRAASILRAISIKGPIGVSKLRIKYGGRKNLGVKPEHFRKGSGKIIRIILQQLEEVKLIETTKIGIRKGRIISNKGKSLLFTTSKELNSASKPKKQIKETTKKSTEEKPVEKKAETKPAEKTETKTESKVE